VALYLEVSYSDGKVETVRVTAKAQVYFERHFNISVFDFARARTIEQTFFMAWQSLMLEGREPPEFEKFLDTIDRVEPVQDTPANPADDKAVNPEQDPTQSAQPTET
jgi:hypothetical protein